MSDLYSEILVSRQPGAKDRWKQMALAVCAAVAAALGFMTSPILFVAAIALAAGSFLTYRRSQAEYEYLIMNKEIDVDVIYAKSKRKKAGEYPLEAMDLLAPLKSYRMEYYNNNQNLKVLDYTSGNPEMPCYAMVTRVQQETCKILLELDENTVECIKRSYPNKVFLD